MSQQTNVELVTDIMECSNHGALIQAFVLEALHRYSNQVIKAGPALFDSELMSGSAWVGCAEEIKAKLNARK